MGGHEGTLQFEYDDFSMKTKIILTCYGGTFGTLKSHETTFLITFVGFTPYWDFKPTNANHVDSRSAYTNEKILKLSTKDKIHLKCDAVDGCVVDGPREAKLFSFVLKTSWI